ncbi:MAG: hypothetical protein HRU19_18640 [Pseudobacteriovorax sp.]|nr:hypothetical protein [Pseudobacteriovorax sp.]
MSKPWTSESTLFQPFSDGPPIALSQHKGTKDNSRQKGDKDLEIKKITSGIEKRLFLIAYNKLSKMSVPLAYVEECDVYGVYVKGEMQGGYAFALGSDMAWPQVLPDANKIFSTVPKRFCLEVNLVWATKDLHASYKNMINFWSSIVTEAANYKHIDYITYAVDVRREYLVKLYKRLSCGVLYRGEVPKYPGREAIVFYSTPFRCKIAKLLCWKEFFIRFHRHLKTKKNHVSSIEPRLAVR